MFIQSWAYNLPFIILCQIYSLADGVCNAAGLGFNGYDDKGRPKWNLVSNINIAAIEVRIYLSTLLFLLRYCRRNCVTRTKSWLRRLMTERLLKMKLSWFMASLCCWGRACLMLVCNGTGNDQQWHLVASYNQMASKLIVDVLCWCLPSLNLTGIPNASTSSELIKRQLLEWNILIRLVSWSIVVNDWYITLAIIGITPNLGFCYFLYHIWFSWLHCSY